MNINRPAGIKDQRLLYWSTIALFIMITLFIIFRLNIWQTLGYSGMQLAIQGQCMTCTEDDECFFKQGDWATIGRVQAESPAEREGLTAGDSVITINGIPADGGTGWLTLRRQLSRGENVTYEILRGNDKEYITIALESPFRNTRYITNLITSILVAILFFGIGLFILKKKPGDKRVVTFFGVCVTTGMLYLWATFLQPENTLSIGMIPDLGLYIIVMLGGMCLSYFTMAMFVHFSFIFPAERPFIKKNRFILKWLYTVPAIVWAVLFFNVFVFYSHHTLLLGRNIISGYDIGLAASLFFEYLFTPSPQILIASVAVISLSIAAAVHTFKVIIRSIKEHSAVRGILHTPHRLLILFYSIIVTGLCGALIYIYFFAPGLESYDALEIYIIAAGILLPVFLFLLIYAVSVLLFTITILVNLFLSYKQSDIEGKRQIRWPLWGFGTALFGSLVFSVPFMMEEFGFISVNNTVYYISDVLRILIYGLIPVSVVIAIVKYRLMDIDIIIKKTVVYSLLSLIVIAFYAVLVFWIGGYVVAALNIQAYWVTAAATVFVAFTFIPLRNKVQRIIDRRFSRKKQDYNTLIEQYKKSITETSGTGGVERRLVECLQTGLQARSVFILQMQADSESIPITAKLGLSDEETGLRMTADDIALLNKTEKPIVVSRVGISESLSQQLKKIRTEIIAPVQVKDGTAALIGIGRKLSNSPYDEDDVDFINKAAGIGAQTLYDLRQREREIDYAKATEIQKALLPRSIPEIEKCRIVASWHPAQSMAGDYYDIIKLSGQITALCVADVVGKGMQAALLMSNLQALVRAYASENMPPARLCTKINSVLGNTIPKGRFITLCIAIIDTLNMNMHYTNAGHNRPLIINTAGKVTLLQSGGPALGLTDEYDYSQESVTLRSGDRVILYTDGITEAMNFQREEFGDDRFIEILRGSAAADLSVLHDRVITAVKSHSGNDLRDDVTFVAAEIS